MKKSHCIALLCCAGVFLFSCAGLLFWHRGSPPCAADENPQGVQIHIAGADYPVEFEDAELSVTDRQRILSDLTVPFSFVPSFEDLKGCKIEADVSLPNGGTCVTTGGRSGHHDGTTGGSFDAVDFFEIIAQCLGVFQRHGNDFIAQFNNIFREFAGSF
jgi:hypothetical protein